MWTSLGLKFVAMMQLIERTVAVAVGGANVFFPLIIVLILLQRYTFSFKENGILVEI